jgi:hypothetical protein
LYYTEPLTEMAAAAKTHVLFERLTEVQAAGNRDNLACVEMKTNSETRRCDQLWSGNAALGATSAGTCQR